MMRFRHKGGQGVSAIFVHAGAGFHSRQSEDLHMWVCNQAATLGMALLRNGGSAVDAVEIAIKFLEDHEVTNAGFGSNLSVTGAVECDATIVDHLGRSGAVGAVQHIKNPISLARMILDASTKPLSLNRVPPNLLVSSGATDFAYENGMPILPADALIAQGARDRWFRWKHDLERVEGRIPGLENKLDTESLSSMRLSSRGSPVASRLSPDHVERSPAMSHGSSRDGNSRFQTPEPCHPDGDELGMPTSDTDGPNTVSADRGGDVTMDTTEDEDADAEADFIDDSFHWETAPSNNTVGADYVPTGDNVANHSTIPKSSDPSHLPIPTPVASVPNSQGHQGQEGRNFIPGRPGWNGIDDDISDTVGAIAVDCHGNIAAGSSSGGIGMKHSGRTGPAALVGIGTAVLPSDPSDDMATSVAAVASGTGEHMATTMAAHTCAERIYSSTQKAVGEPGGFEFVTEDEAMKSMIENDFMGHPAVKGSHCHAAIGVMSIKKTRDGIAFLFGHNTDSFAVANMSSEDIDPCCAMSRTPGNGKVAQGGRFMRFGRYKSSSPATS